MVYIYTLSDGSNIRYIGKTNNTKDRKRRHLSKYYLKKNTYKNNWIKSVIKEANNIQIEILDEVPLDEWTYWEQYWIEQFIQWGFNLTNGTIGGEGIILTPEIIKKRNESNRKSKKSLNHKKNLNKYINLYDIKIKEGKWNGKRECPNGCGNYISYNSKNINTIYRTIKSANEKNRVCNSCKISGEKNYFYGKKLNDGNEKRKRMGKNVLQYDKNGNFVKEYESIREASLETKIDRKSISRCAHNKPSYNSAGGYLFKFK